MICILLKLLFSGIVMRSSLGKCNTVRKSLLHCSRNYETDVGSIEVELVTRNCLCYVTYVTNGVSK